MRSKIKSSVNLSQSIMDMFKKSILDNLISLNFFSFKMPIEMQIDCTEIAIQRFLCKQIESTDGMATRVECVCEHTKSGHRQ